MPRSIYYVTTGLDDGAESVIAKQGPTKFFDSKDEALAWAHAQLSGFPRIEGPGHYWAMVERGQWHENMHHDHDLGWIDVGEFECDGESSYIVQEERNA